MMLPMISIVGALGLAGVARAAEADDGTVATLPTSLAPLSADRGLDRGQRNGGQAPPANGGRGGSRPAPPDQGGGSRPAPPDHGGAQPAPPDHRPPPPNAGPRPSPSRPAPGPAHPAPVRPAPKAGPHPIVRPRPGVAHPVHAPVFRRPGVGVPHPSVSFRVVRPYHGVFVWGPRPVYHSRYHGTNVAVAKTELPTRQVDRDDTVAVGLRMGSLYGGYSAGGAYADLGLGFNLRFRPEEALGLELALQSYNQRNADSDRHQTVGQLSAELFAFPWSRVSPYVLTGVTFTGRNIDDDYYDDGVRTAMAQDVLTGLHGGLGVEFAVGDRIAIDLEGRYVGYLDKPPQDASWPGGFQTTAGLVYHF